jgi:hypothetical protein
MRHVCYAVRMFPNLFLFLYSVISAYVTPYESMIDELEATWKSSWSNLNTISKFDGGAEEKHGTVQSGHTMFKPRFEPGTSRMSLLRHCARCGANLRTPSLRHWSLATSLLVSSPLSY